MKSKTIYMSILLLLAFSAAACNPTSELPLTPVITETGIQPPGTESTLLPPKETEPGFGPTPESTLGAKGAITGTAVITPTGFVDPGRVTNMLDFGVWNRTGEQIGEVEDLVLNLGTAHMDYVVVNANSETGASQQFILVPWEALIVVSVQAQTTSESGPQNDFILTVEQVVFDNAPRIELEAIPEINEEATDWDLEIRSFWQEFLPSSLAETPYPDTTGIPEIAGQIAPDRVAQVTETLNFSFAIASIQIEVALVDLILDINTGDIQYVVIAIRNEAMSDALIPVPPEIISWDSINETYTLSVSPEVLLQAPRFKNDEYPVTQILDWDAEFSTFWAKYLPTPISLFKG